MARVSIAIVCIYILCHTPKILPTLCEIIYMNRFVIVIIVILVIITVAIMINIYIL